jgi:hypothetical protein
MTEYIAQLQERVTILSTIIHKLRLEVHEVDPNFIGSIKNCENSDIKSRLECTIEILENTIDEWYTYLDKISVKWEDLQCLIGIQPQKSDKKDLQCGIAYFLRYNFQPQASGSVAPQQIGISIERIDVKFDNYWTPQKALSKIQEIANHREVKTPSDPRELYTTLVKMSSDIATDTRRGAGNNIVTSPQLFDYIKSMDQFEKSEGLPRMIQRMGTIGRFAVFTNHKYDGMQALISYRGSKDNDCGSAVATWDSHYAFAFDELSKNYYQRVTFT